MSVSRISASLAGSILSTFAYGVFFVVWLTSMVFMLNYAVSITKHHFHGYASYRRVIVAFIKRPLTIGGILLFVCITGVGVAHSFLPHAQVVIFRIGYVLLFAHSENLLNPTVTQIYKMW
jgi:hypothetical protein